VVDYEVFVGGQNETVVKELYVCSAAASETFSLKPPTKWRIRLDRIGTYFIDGHRDHWELHTVHNEAVASFAHLYAYGVSKCTFLVGLTGRPFHNLEDVNCPLKDYLNHVRWCTLPCHKFRKFACATKSAHSVYD